MALTQGIEKVTCIHPTNAKLKRNIAQNYSKLPPGNLRASRFLYEANIGLSIILGRSLYEKSNGKELATDEVLIAESYLQALGGKTKLIQKKATTSSTTEQPKFLTISDISEGLMVFHPTFGAGTVTAITDKKQGRLTVLFDDHGEKAYLLLTRS